ncbi:MAG: mobile mystery protein A [Phycisphaerae bacterium]|nr:mobile mystery protein A [Phycisphaerae bacterium]
MQPKHKKLAREQLDETLTQLAPLKTLIPPRKGWIRAIRQALGMTGDQLAKRLQASKQRISRIEQDEVCEKLTISTLRRVAECLDCTLVYGLIPRQSLEYTVQHQARLLAQKRLNHSNQMMRLEHQELRDQDKIRVLEDLVREIVAEMPKALWEER